MCGLWGDVPWVPWTVWVNCHSPKADLPCGSTWHDRWSGEFCDCKLLGVTWLFFFHLFSAFSCTLLGKVAFLRMGLLVTTFSTSDSSLGLAEVLQRLEVPAGWVLQPGPSQVRGTWAEECWEAVLVHLLGCYQLGMDAVSWLDSCQPEAVAILGDNRWGQWTSGTPHILNLYSPCLSGHKNKAVELLWLSENRSLSWAITGPKSCQLRMS